VKKPSEILRDAASLISPMYGWTQRAGARDSDGMIIRSRVVGEPYPGAICYCADGAMFASKGPGNQLAYSYASGFLCRTLGINSGDITDWNDSVTRTQPEVVTALQKAADLAESEGM
jgi:hypothetical protein